MIAAPRWRRLRPKSGLVRLHNSAAYWADVDCSGAGETKCDGAAALKKAKVADPDEQEGTGDCRTPVYTQAHTCIQLRAVSSDW